MGYSFEYIDIILLAMIAGFIFLRLRGILGKRTGFEGKNASSFEKVLKDVNIRSNPAGADRRELADGVRPRGEDVARTGRGLRIADACRRARYGGIEGIELKEKKLFSVQYHPESNPGPQDSKYLFDKFLENIKTVKKNGKKKRY